MLVGSNLRLNHVAFPHCGADLTVEPSQAGHSDPMEVQAFASKKIAAGICGILLGGLGVNKFILEFNPAGIHYADYFANRSAA